MSRLQYRKHTLAGCLAAAALWLAPHLGAAQTGVKPGNMSSVYQHAPPSAGQYQPGETHGSSNEYHAPPPEFGYAPAHPNAQEYAQRTDKDLTPRQINKGIAAHQAAQRKAVRKKTKKYTAPAKQSSQNHPKA